jgi:hypothetical protein
MMNNKAGLLKYFLEGAYDYYQDPNREVPESMKNTKAKAVKELDVATGWIKGYLVHDENKSRKVKLADMKALWRNDPSLNALYALSRTRGFNEKFMEKVKKHHPKMEVNIHPDRSNEAYVKYCRLHTEDDDSDEEKKSPGKM